MAEYIYVNINDAYNTSAGNGIVDYPYTCDEWLEQLEDGPNGFGIEEDTIYVVKGYRTPLADFEMNINARYDNISISAIAWESTPWKIKTAIGGAVFIKTGTSGYTPNIHFGGGIIETKEEGQFEIIAYDSPENKTLDIDNMWLHNQSA